MAKKRTRTALKVAIATCGGDCPGLNAAIAAAVRRCASYGFTTVGVKDGLSSFMEGSLETTPLGLNEVKAIQGLGGTVLGTSNKGSPFRDPKVKQELLKKIKASWKAMNLDAMIAIGGDGSQYMMKDLDAIGLSVVGIPKTIDNDLTGSDFTIGFSTAVDSATTAASALRHSADSHHRVMILEVMGRDSGHIALHSGLAADADCILMPEIPVELSRVIGHVKERQRLRGGSYLIVAAEGATITGMEKLYKQASSGAVVLGGIGQLLTEKIHEETGFDVRNTVLGHIQRGGIPNATDRILANRLAIHAVDLIAYGDAGNIVAIKNNKITHFPYAKLSATRYKVPLSSDLVTTAEGVGICLGREPA